MKTIFKLICISFLLFSCIDKQKEVLYEFKIKITFCDNREPIVKNVQQYYLTTMIRTYKQAVPIFYLGDKKYLNVCDVEILETKPV